VTTDEVCTKLFFAPDNPFDGRVNANRLTGSDGDIQHLGKGWAMIRCAAPRAQTSPSVSALTSSSSMRGSAKS